MTGIRSRVPRDLIETNLALVVPAAASHRWRPAGETMQTALAAFWYDVRHAVRGYLRTPLFTSVAIATLALGIGSTTAIFSVIDAVVWRALPYPHASGLVAVAELRRETGAVLPMSPPNYF